MEWVFDLGSIHEVATAFWTHYSGRKVFAFHGLMGSGKTTFIHTLCETLQVSSPVTSPTFSIINEYAFPAGKIFHLDLYRIKNEDEAIRAGVEDCLYSGEICLVEWPEKAPGIFPPDTQSVFISLLDPATRKISDEAPR